jgi:hypothetical protein
MVVYQIYDNNAFFCALEDGSKTLLVRSEDDNRFHVTGRLEVADHGVVKNLVNLINIIPCCTNGGHITNRGEDDFKQKMCADLGEFKKSLKGLIFGKKIRNFKVLYPLDLMYGDSGGGDERPKRGFWKNDPVHPIPAGYENLLNGIIKKEISFNRSYTAGGGGKKQQAAKHHKRQQWVEQDDATTHNVYKDDFQQNKGQRGRGGSQRSRGCRGGRFIRGGKLPGKHSYDQQYSRFKPY